MERVDRLLVDQDLAASRTQAQKYISEGKVQVLHSGNWQTVKKPSEKFAGDAELKVALDESDRFVSRGGLKLAGALERIRLDITGMTVIDVGQSTGGFTDCALQSGAARVVGIEVGHDQLVEKLRKDERVICLEGVNARELSPTLIENTENSAGFDLAVMDVSFISQTKIIPSLAPLIKEGGFLISLVKPQFEVGKAGLSKGGIVRDDSLYPEVESSIRNCLEKQGLKTTDYFDSPIKGGDGNREFLIIARKA
ncbi:TlyA family RNA methyltransferase [Endozoicomonas numazuensis]|uniref:Hemolysin n=1 Tax=Endozoicomonas numazuensis TaxID=1137799 RepID=A0A081N6A5_9GAMM|nr:TlyA family RNA methyltransferase [Endozoicomonas numazuensis]KEQ13978.1 hemolysin [Endozoicomonas numazuensis]